MWSAPCLGIRSQPRNYCAVARFPEWETGTRPSALTFPHQHTAQRGNKNGLGSLTSRQCRYAPVNVEQSYSPSFEKLLALSLTAFIAILGPFHPIISSFLSSSSSVAMKNFSSSC